MCLFQFWFPQCVCPAGGLLGHMAVLFPVFKGISTLFSIVAIIVCIPTNSVRGFPFLHTLSSIIVCRFLESSHSDWSEMVPHCGFDLHFSNNAFELSCWRRLLRVPWSARRSNQSILKEISPGISLEGMMLKLKLQYSGHLMRRVDSQKRL